MPTYGYRCEACGHEFEEYQSITSKPIKVCPECKREKVRRLIGTGSALLFKGSGFYETDYRSSSYRQAAKSERDSCSTTSPASKSAGTGTSGGNGHNGTGK
jgi:putative FmdB family regulatory protein